MKFRRRKIIKKGVAKYVWECQYKYQRDDGIWKTFTVPAAEYSHLNIENVAIRLDFEKQYSSPAELEKLHSRRGARKRVNRRQKQERPSNHLLDIFYESRKHMANIGEQLRDVQLIMEGFCPAHDVFELDQIGRKVRLLQKWLLERPKIKTVKSANNKLATFNQFLRILYEEGKTEALIWIPPISAPKYPEFASRKKGPEVVIPENIEAQIRAFLPERYRLQFDAMIGLGLRVSEPNRLKLSDIHFDAQNTDFPDLFRALDGAGVQAHGVVDIKYQLNCRTQKEAKAKTTGVVAVLWERTQISLAQAWLEAYERGQECLFQHISPFSFKNAFYSAVAKLPEQYHHLSPHDLRHTFCTRAAAIVPEPCRDLLMALTRHNNWLVCERYRHNLRMLKGQSQDAKSANLEQVRALVAKKTAR